MEPLIWIASVFWLFTPPWAKALLVASPLALGAFLLARARNNGPGP